MSASSSDSPTAGELLSVVLSMYPGQFAKAEEHQRVEMLAQTLSAWRLAADVAAGRRVGDAVDMERLRAAAHAADEESKTQADLEKIPDEVLPWTDSRLWLLAGDYVGRLGAGDSDEVVMDRVAKKFAHRCKARGIDAINFVRKPNNAVLVRYALEMFKDDLKPGPKPRIAENCGESARRRAEKISDPE